ncbi:response regulator [Breoghania sp.]|uniref:response regulator transcription factor n=1 Tax=Breoghania sp. TaxID=2065378 RepID=UPI0029CA215F|nr:response regulator [Breoghania sp.]
MFNIVIIEDEELERRALRRIIETNLDSARIVGEARNGTEAVRLIETCQIDLMLVDIRIPRPNGLEIIQMVRDRGMQTKVIILTAYDYFEIMQSAIHLKADNFLLKPVRTDDLLKAVSACLGTVDATASTALPDAPPSLSIPSARRDDAPLSFPTQADPETVAETAHIARQIAELVESTSYRACLTLVRQRLEAIYARKDVPPRRAVLEYIRTVVRVAEERQLAMPSCITRKIDALAQQRLDLHSHYQMLELVYQIVDVLFEAREPGGAHASDYIQDVLNYIERNLHKGVTLEEAAGFANISSCYLSRLFRKEMGGTFISYLKTKRIERAKELLADSDLPITNVSLDLSFQDANYFCKAFKKEVGVSPSEYRRQYRRPVVDCPAPSA